MLLAPMTVGGMEGGVCKDVADEDGMDALCDATRGVSDTTAVAMGVGFGWRVVCKVGLLDTCFEDELFGSMGERAGAIPF